MSKVILARPDESEADYNIRNVDEGAAKYPPQLRRTRPSPFSILSFVRVCQL